MGTTLVIENALLYSGSTRTLLSYRDIRKNSFHIKTCDENNKEFLLITRNHGYGKATLEKVSSLSSGLYYTYLKHVQHAAYKVIFQNVNAF
jgi:hypothetical protein